MQISEVLKNKYGRDNWKKRREDGLPSIPISCWLNHAEEHFYQLRKRDTSEPHAEHCATNLYMAWWLLKRLEEKEEQKEQEHED
jgi:hypothetical protein